MRAITVRVLAGVLGALSLNAVPVNAAEPGFYIGGMFGDASKDTDISPFVGLTDEIYSFIDFTPDTRTFATDDDSKAYGFLAGYRLTQHIAFEGGYTYIGKETYREQASGVFTGVDPDEEEDWNVSLARKTSGFSLSVLGILPVSYLWEVYARGGVLIGSNTMSVYANNGGVLLQDELSESSTDMLAGIGASFSLAEVYSLRVEYQRIFDAGDPSFGESDVDLISLGVTVAF